MTCVTNLRAKKTERGSLVRAKRQHDGPIQPDPGVSKRDNTEAWQEKRRLAAAMRRVMERLVSSDAPVAELRDAADMLERLAGNLEKYPRLRHFHQAESAAAGDVGVFFDRSPLVGLSNALAPPMEIARNGERAAVGRVRFGSAHEGAPGCVHGGFVAAAFDEFLGFLQWLTERPGMTATLTVRYRSPTPLHTDLILEGEVERVEGKKIFTTGRLFAGKTLCAEAVGLFISVDREKVEELLRKRIERERHRNPEHA